MSRFLILAALALPIFGGCERAVSSSPPTSAVNVDHELDKALIQKLMEVADQHGVDLDKARKDIASLQAQVQALAKSSSGAAVVLRKDLDEVRETGRATSGMVGDLSRAIAQALAENLKTDTKFVESIAALSKRADQQGDMILRTQKQLLEYLQVSQNK